MNRCRGQSVPVIKFNSISFSPTSAGEYVLSVLVICLLVCMCFALTSLYLMPKSTMNHARSEGGIQEVLVLISNQYVVCFLHTTH